ncbi:Peroxidase 44 [Striga hermonthica]|uniref:Peroxidase n=1 Tax=Striga hermonthica TaxID=68872 RepID=A0A9N7RM72_STRHE|nr:Peroxidase 44 [Striga hermonthica]
MVKIVALFFLFTCCLLISLASAQLKVGFYASICPRAESIIRGVVQQRFNRDRSITAALLRMHFHDCFVRGCDASILIDSTASLPSEKDAGPNETVRGYDLIDSAKKALETTCPSTVSCADIITLATRDAVALAGGPKYNVPTGRRDGLVSDPNGAANLPGPSDLIRTVLGLFRAKGLTAKDTVALLGAHTVGVAHCTFFQDRLTGFGPSGIGPDTNMDPGLAARLRRVCGTDIRPLDRDPTAFLDQGTPFGFDNQFYNQTVFRRGVLEIDRALAADRTTRPIVSDFAKNGVVCGQSFASAMVKMSKIEVLVGKAGEIRRNCRVFNPKPSRSRRGV